MQFIVNDEQIIRNSKIRCYKREFNSQIEYFRNSGINSILKLNVEINYQWK